MSEKLVLIDGHSILNRAFYGLPDLTNSKGIHTNAVYGFLNILFKIMEEEAPDYLIVAFDVKTPTFRHEMFPEYKGTRKAMPQELREQVPLMKKVLSAMNIYITECPGYEADDLLGTMAVMGEKMGLKVSLISGDRDLLQIASDNIKIRIPKTKRTGTEIEDYLSKDVVEKYGIKPSGIVDMKGLMGDTADNIPGVPGIGEKTALKILASFETLENAYEHIDEIKPDKARKNMIEYEEQARLSKRLAKIKTDCEITENFPECGRINYNPEHNDNPLKGEGIFTKEAYDLFFELEFKSFLVRFDFNKKAGENADNAGKAVKTKKLSSACDIREFFVEAKERLFPEALSENGVSTDEASEKEIDLPVFAFELYGNDETLSGFSFGYKEGEGFVFGTGSVPDIKMPDGMAEEQSEGAKAETEEKIENAEPGTGDEPKNKIETSKAGFIREFTKIFLSEIISLKENCIFITNRLKEQLHLLDYEVWESMEALFCQSRVYDLSVGAYLINPLKDSYLRDDIARDFLMETVKSRQELFGKKTWNEICLTGEFTGFANENLRIYLKAYKDIREKINEYDMSYLYEEVEMPLVYVLFSMEKEGIAVKRDELKRYGDELSGKIISLEREIHELAGEEFNINSPKQLGVILFEKLKLPNGKKTKTGYSTSADVLNKLREESPIIDKILYYRQLAKLKSTYADGLAAFIEKDGRIHGKFHQTVTATGRLSSAEPNLQNIPIRTEEGRKIRKVFVPRPGCIFLDADYSQIELRIMAHMSGDEKMIEAYHSAADIHQATASLVFNTPMDKVTKQQRRNAKAVNFGIIYGISSFGLGQDLDISKKEAEKYIKNYFETYPKIEAYMKQLVDTAKEKGYVFSMFKRIRPIPELKSSNFMQRSFGERAAMNAPIQGTAADIMKIAMVRVYKRMKREGLKSKMLVQVHDEILIETLPEEKDRVKLIMEEEMKGAAKLKVPLEIEVSEGNDWYEAK